MNEQELLYTPHCPDPMPCPRVIRIKDEMIVIYSKPDVELRIKGIKNERLSYKF